MDSFEINKILAAILIVALLLIGIGKISNVIFYVEKPKSPSYMVEVNETIAKSAIEIATDEKKVDIKALMALGDAASGEKIFKKCDSDI